MSVILSIIWRIASLSQHGGTCISLEKRRNVCEKKNRVMLLRDNKGGKLEMSYPACYCIHLYAPAQRIHCTRTGRGPSHVYYTGNMVRLRYITNTTCKPHVWISGCLDVPRQRLSRTVMLRVSIQERPSISDLLGVSLLESPLMSKGPYTH